MQQSADETEPEDSIMSRSRWLLAFVHIEKAAGTTLYHILRRNFFMRHLEVRPFAQESDMIFRASDLKRSFWLNPSLCSIGGHSVKAFADLETVVKDIKYITLLRDPRTRYVSHYYYHMSMKKTHIHFREYLKYDEELNFQTSSLSTGNYRGNRSACSADLERAKELLAGKFSLVGVVEEFDEFLIHLRRFLRPKRFDPRYSRQNVSRAEDRLGKETPLEILTKYNDEILENNQLDLKLYEYVVSCLIPRQRAEYGSTLHRDVNEFQQTLGNSKLGMLRLYIDYAVRRCYYDPLIGVQRVCHGLPYSGVY
jgi:hypothetical protein